MPPRHRSFRSIVIGNEPRVAAVPASHSLASASEVSLSDLVNETLIVVSATGTTTLDLWPAAPRPRIGADLTNIDDWLIAIAASTGIGVTPASTATLHPHPDVRFIPIRDAPTVPLVLVWPRSNSHPHTKAFVASAQRSVLRMAGEETN